MKVINLILIISILLFIILNNNFVNSNEVSVGKSNSIQVRDKSKGKQEKIKVFIVHGRNAIARQNVYDKLTKMGFEAVILYEQANNGDTIIEKLEREVDKCKFGVVIVSPDNIAYSKSSDNKTYTEMAYPRLNVIFEFGLLIGKYGRDNVIYLSVPYNGITSAYDLPSDLLGYVWVNYTDTLDELENEINIGDYRNSNSTSKSKTKNN